MTTLDPGASEVLTHGLEARLRSTALRASRPAASITDGLEVLVQLVMAAITTWPWSRSKRAPSSSWTGTRLWAAADPCGVGLGTSRPALVVVAVLDHSGHGAGGSLAGNDSAEASSGPSSWIGWVMSARAARKLRRASVRATRSWGRRGPGLGTTVPRSSSTVSE